MGISLISLEYLKIYKVMKYRKIFIKHNSSLWMSSLCLVTVSVLWLLLMMSLVGLQCVTVVFPDHTLILFVFPA